MILLLIMNYAKNSLIIIAFVTTGKLVRRNADLL